MEERYPEEGRGWGGSVAQRRKPGGAMDCQLRKWKTEDAAALSAVLSNQRAQDNLRDGIPCPYTVRGRGGSSSTIAADEIGNLK